MRSARPSPSTLKGRLVDVYLAALVDGAIEPLSRRLGGRATIEDPTFGHAAGLAAIGTLLGHAAAFLRDHHAGYRHRRTTTGRDRDLAEGVLSLDGPSARIEVPILVVGERKREREIDLRLYHAIPPEAAASPSMPDPSEAPLGAQSSTSAVVLPQLVKHVVDALRIGALERFLAAFEGAAQLVDVDGTAHSKRDGSMGAFLTSVGARIDLDPAAFADDGRICGVEGAVRFGASEPRPACLVFERGDTGLFRELRLYVA